MKHSRKRLYRVISISFFIVLVVVIISTQRREPEVVVEDERVRDDIRIALTDEQRSYLAHLGPIRMAVDPDWEPFELIVDGEFIGIAADLISLIVERLDLDMHLVHTHDWNESIQLAKQREVHLLAFLNQTPEREEYLVFTDSYFQDPNVLITHEKHDYISDLHLLFNETVVLPAGTSVEEHIRRNYPQLSIIIVDTEAEAYAMVQSQKADITIRSLSMAAYTIRKEGLFNLKIAGQIPELTNRFRMGVIKEEPQLRDILNEGIATITAKDQRDAINAHIAIEVNTGVNRRVIGWIIVIFVSTVLAVLLWNNFLRRINRKLYNHEQALEHVQEMLRYIIEHDSSAIAVLNKDLTYMYVSRKYCSLFEIQGSVVGRTHKDLYEELSSFWAQGILQALDGSVVGKNEDRFVAWNGKTIWISWECRPFLYKDGTIGGVVIYVQDITVQKKMVDELSTSEEKYRLLTEHTSDVIWVMQVENRTFTYISPSVLQLRGYTPEEAMAQTMEESTDSISYELLSKALPQELEYFIAHPHEPKTFITEIRQPCKDGSYIWVEISSKLRFSKEGVIEIVGVSRNVDERKKAEERIRYLSYHDQMTGVYNRHYYEEVVSSLEAKGENPIALVVADVNGLKKINDQYGHKAGDQLLICVATTLQQLITDEDDLFRIGGDEFVLLLSGTTYEGAISFIRQACDQLHNQRIENHVVSVAFGWAMYEGKHSSSFQDLFVIAENRMYDHKRGQVDNCFSSMS